MDPVKQLEQSKLAPEITTIKDVANTVVGAVLGLSKDTELPPYFQFGGDYHRDQFNIGWVTRGIIDCRVPGEAAFLTHPDAGKVFDQLSEGVKGFVKLMSTLQVAIYGQLSVSELLALKKSGEEYKFAIQETPLNSCKIFVPEKLLAKVNLIHHETWMLARSLARIIDPNITIRNHQAHKEHSLMTPAEIAADDASVQGYGVTLASIPSEQFDYLLTKAKA